MSPVKGNKCKRVHVHSKIWLISEKSAKVHVHSRHFLSRSISAGHFLECIMAQEVTNRNEQI